MDGWVGGGEGGKGRRKIALLRALELSSRFTTTVLAENGPVCILKHHPPFDSEAIEPHTVCWTSHRATAAPFFEGGRVAVAVTVALGFWNSAVEVGAAVARYLMTSSIHCGCQHKRTVQQ